MLKSRLSLHDFKFNVHLGVTPGERENSQEIILNIIIETPHPAESCLTDSEDGYLCYEEVGRKMTLWLDASSYKTIEFLTMYLWKKLARLCPPQSWLKVTTTKPHPPIVTPNAGASFSLEGVIAPDSEDSRCT